MLGILVDITACEKGLIKKSGVLINEAYCEKLEKTGRLEFTVDSDV